MYREQHASFSNRSNADLPKLTHFVSIQNISQASICGVASNNPICVSRDICVLLLSKQCYLQAHNCEKGLSIYGIWAPRSLKGFAIVRRCTKAACTITNPGRYIQCIQKICRWAMETYTWGCHDHVCWWWCYMAWQLNKKKSNHNRCIKVSKHVCGVYIRNVALSAGKNNCEICHVLAINGP